MKELTGEWLDKAENDYVVAVREFESDPPVYEAACFHAQQCIEKLIKAFYCEQEIRFPKTHDLTLLVDICPEAYDVLHAERDSITKLSIYAVEIRYPGSLVTKSEAEDCISILRALKPKLLDLIQ